MRNHACAFSLLCLAISCSTSEERAPKPPAIETTIGTVRVRLEPDPLRIVLTRVDGRVLFDGLAPRDVPAGDDENDPPPLTGLAVRDTTTKVQALYGSYQFTDQGTWRVARRASNVKSGGAHAGTLTFDAVGDGGAVAKVEIRAEGDAELTIAITPTTTAAAGARTWTSIAAQCTPDEQFLGFGAQARDVAHRGTVVPVFVSEPGIGKRDDDARVPIWYLSGARHSSSFPVPLYLARSGYVGALDGPGRAVFGMCGEEDSLRISGDSDAASGRTFLFRMFLGNTPKEALGRSTAFFGRPRVPSRLAFAPWNDTILGSGKVRELAQLLRDADIPTSAIWYEDWRGGRFVGDDYKLEEEWDVDATLYPEFDALVRDLHDQGIASFTYFNTFVEQDNSVWKDAHPKGYLVAKADGSTYTSVGVKQKQVGMVDLTNAAAKAWMVAKLKATLARGVDGWMGDYGEWLPLDGALADKSDPWATHDLYPELWQKTQREALDAADLGAAASPKERRVAFVRSGWLRSAPLADVVWAGDQATDMSEDDGLATIIPMGLGLSIAGISTYGHDIAGYQVALRAPADKETFFRWTELGAWSPVMRTHHGTQPLKNWNLTSDAETTQHWRRYAILHQQLLPYWELLAKEANETGIAIWRHLAVEFPDDPRAWTIGDEAMVGPSVLLAPVVKKGARTRSVYLPKGARWTPWTGGAAVEGGVSVEVPAALGEIPVFIRVGSILPLLPDRVRTVIEEAKGVVRVSDVGDDRELLVVTGGAAKVIETSGLEYTLADGKSGATAWNGETLGECATPPVAPCKAASIAYVTGAGTLTDAAATLTVKGGSPTRALRIDLRRP